MDVRGRAEFEAQRHKGGCGTAGERGLLGRPPRSWGAHAHTDEEECPVRPSWTAYKYNRHVDAVYRMSFGPKSWPKNTTLCCATPIRHRLRTERRGNNPISRLIWLLENRFPDYNFPNSHPLISQSMGVAGEWGISWNLLHRVCPPHQPG